MNNQNEELINVKISNDESFEYKLGEGMPTEGGYEISKQAKNFSMSKVDFIEGKSGVYYQFKPQANFTGVEKIEIILRMSPGDNNFKIVDRWNFEIEIE